MKKVPALALEETIVREYSPTSRWGFYRPHSRLATAYTGHLVDPLTGELVKPPARTKQEFKEQCDINNIIKSFKITRQITHLAAKAGTFEDLPDALDLQTALNVVIQAEDAFAALPAAVRDRFKNNPSEFLAFMEDPKNMVEAEKLGLVTITRPAPTSSSSATPPPEKAEDNPA